MPERFWILKRCDLFERLNAEQLSRLESRARFRRCARDEAIYLPGDDADGVLLLTEGRVRICDSTPDGKQQLLAFIEPGELFGELSLIDSLPRDERAEAVVPSSVVLIPAAAMQELLSAVPELSVGITKLIGFRRRRVERRLKMLMFRSNRERLIHLLIELAEQYGRPDPAGTRIGLKLSHQELASLIGSTRESVTVILGALQNEKTVRIARRTIILTDPQRMVEGLDLVLPRVLQDGKPNATGRKGSSAAAIATAFSAAECEIPYGTRIPNRRESPQSR